ncbi:putative acetyltransferase, partial [Cucurbita argyrosperma subsp. sororia]
MNPHYPPLRHISSCFVKPELDCLPQESKQPLHLSPLDLPMLSAHYIQKGLLFHKPPDAYHHPHTFMPNLLHRLKASFSTALLHFYPLSGRLATTINDHPPSISVYVDCVNSPGAKFIHAALDTTISDVLSPVDVPSVVHSFFDHDRAVNYDGQTMPLLSIQVTELLDGVFIGCSFNHVIGDGTSYWNFFNMWSEIFQAPSNQISRPPVLKRWFPDGYGPIINLPFTHTDQFISRFEAPQLRERMFHFSAESIAKLKAKAKTECGSKGISSFQSLSALVWRSITRARRIAEDQPTICMMAANGRARLEPPFSENYFGNVVRAVKAEAKAGELLEKELGWAALKLHDAVVNITDKNLRDSLDQWLQSPYTFQLGRFFSPNSIMMGSSPRFNVYGNEFGMGKAVALRSGYANKFDGKVSSFPGNEGGGSIDLEICLLPQNMAMLESDLEFMNVVSSSPFQPCES